MNTIFEFEFSLNAKDSMAFAQLSGDYNPIHTDPIAARRTQFGGTVIHGIHLALHAIDRLVRESVLNAIPPKVLSVTFGEPVPTGIPVRATATVQEGIVRVVVSTAAQKEAFRMTLEPNLSPAIDKALIDEGLFEVCSPEDVNFPPSLSECHMPLKADDGMLQQLFPAIAGKGFRAWIADLLATTRIVGMHVPGMNSVFARLKLQTTQDSFVRQSTSMRYRVIRCNERFRLIGISVHGATVAGELEALFRPRPVSQRSMNEVVALVAPDEFAGENALIVGGSRGLGELAAKILAAGGANVTITYAQGRKDAERVCREIHAKGNRCAAYELRVNSSQNLATSHWVGEIPFTQTYFFASPSIAKNLGSWDDALYGKFHDTYVAGFEKLAKHLLAAAHDSSRRLDFFYPSSIFVQRGEPGFAEYIAAKTQGESLCRELLPAHGSRFVTPRLPRLLTDQTNGSTGPAPADPFPILLDAIRDFHSGRDPDFGLKAK